MLNFSSVITRFPCIVFVESSLLLLIPNERVLYYISIFVCLPLGLLPFFYADLRIRFPDDSQNASQHALHKTTHLYLTTEFTPH